MIDLVRDLGQRRLRPELMDQPGLDRALHHQALRGLERVNLISRTVAVLWKEIQRFAEANSGTPLHVLDVACGGGDAAISLWRRAHRSGFPIRLSACDISQTAIDYARVRARASEAAVKFFQADVIRNPFPDGFDVICCSLFLHHLKNEDLIAFLSGMRQSSARLLLAIDLRRTWWGYILAWSGVRLLTRSKICHVDGPLSVKAAYTIDEIRNLSEQAGMQEVELVRHWPQRYLLAWRRP